jgi:NitT/TauT family transport system substrate-binding protein
MKKIVSIVLAVSMLAVCVTGCKTTTRKQLKPVVLNEVAHSIFYAPQYAASSFSLSASSFLPSPVYA